MKNFRSSILLRKPYSILFGLACYLFSGVTSLAQETPLLDWAKNTGARLYNPGDGIATDASGNVYTTGNFFGTQDFDPGPDVFNMSVTGSDDGIFISKLNANGDFVWAKSIKNVYNTADGITVDASGNVIIVGFFDKGDVMDFDPGPGTFNLSAVGYDMFVLKLDTNGDFMWVKHIKGASTAAHAFPQSIALDAAGNIYTTGYFQTTIDFDPGAGTHNLTAGEARDIFISKLDANGNFVWAKAMLGAGTCGVCDDKARSIALDAAGNVYTSGFLRGTADFDPGPGTFNLTPTSGGGFFISKLDNNGNFIWAKTFGGAASGVADTGDMALDASGNIFITGAVYGTSDFDPGPSTFTLASAGSSDIFICKLTINGDFVWAKLFGAGSGDYASTIDTDGSGNIYTAGVFNGTVDFDPGPGTFNLAGSNDYVLQKLDNDGNFVWAYSMNSGTETSIKVQLPNIYITGQLQAGNTADLDPGPCSLNSNPGAVFIKKLHMGTAIPGPTISSFTPAVAPIGTTITITGTHFSTTPANNLVKFFNNKTATVTASTATSITTTVPPGSITGKISLTTNCITVVSANDFTIGAATLPIITSFNPVNGIVGTTVTITGTNFSNTPANNTVKFNGTTSTVTASTSTTITTTIPSGATTGKLTVTVGGNTATSSTDFTVTSAPGIIINTQPQSVSVCEAENASLNLTASGAANLTYQWQKFNGSIFSNISNGGGYTGVTTATLNINTTGNFGAGEYRCKVSGSSTPDVFSSTAALTVNPYPVATITFNGTQLTTSPGDSYQWYQNDEEVDGSNSQTFALSVLEYGVYKVDVTSKGCTTTSADFVYSITANEESFHELFTSYPNPFADKLYINWKSNEPGEIQIINSMGQESKTQKLKNGLNEIDLQLLPTGLYPILIRSEHKNYLIKGIKN